MLQIDIGYIDSEEKKIINCSDVLTVEANVSYFMQFFNTRKTNKYNLIQYTKWNNEWHKYKQIGISACKFEHTCQIQTMQQMNITLRQP